MHCWSNFDSRTILAVAAATALTGTSVVHAQTTRPATQPATQPSRPAAQPAPSPDEPAARPTLPEQIAAAHNEAAWDAQRAISFTIDLTFGESLNVVADITYDYRSNRVHMELADGPTLVFDGENAWVSPGDVQFPMARFHLLTWPYFVAVPFKLDDPGTNFDDKGIMRLREKPHLATKLTFDTGVGDSPDDWYILYADPAGHQLKSMAYIVTYGGTDVQEAEKSSHAITYDTFGIFNGVVLATQWEFYNWNEEEGIHGEALGQASLSNVRFVEPTDELFAQPADAREDKLPGEQ